MTCLVLLLINKVQPNTKEVKASNMLSLFKHGTIHELEGTIDLKEHWYVYVFNLSFRMHVCNLSIQMIVSSSSPSFSYNLSINSFSLSFISC